MTPEQKSLHHKQQYRTLLNGNTAADKAAEKFWSESADEYISNSELGARALAVLVVCAVAVIAVAAVIAF